MAQRTVDVGSTAEFYDRLLDLSREAHAAGLHEVAYHALCGALHAAQSGGDSAGVAAIAAEARQQIEWIDRHAPKHRLSTSSANQHDHPGVYAMLGRQAEMMSRMIEREAGGG